MGKPDRFNNKTIQSAAEKLLPGCKTQVSCDGNGFMFRVSTAERYIDQRLEMTDVVGEFSDFSTKFLQPMIASLSNG